MQSSATSKRKHERPIDYAAIGVEMDRLINEARENGAPESAIDEWRRGPVMAYWKAIKRGEQVAIPEISFIASVVPTRRFSDPIITPIEGETLPIITADILPDWARDYVRALADSSEMDETLGTLTALAAIASTVQHQFKIETAAGHTEHLPLMTAAAMGSGERKSSTHNRLIAPLIEAQKKLAKDRHMQQKRIGIERRIAERQIRALEREEPNGEAEKAKQIESILAIESAMPAQIGDRQLVVNDFTEAALTRALASNEESLLLASDEGGLFDNLAGRFSDTPEIVLVLDAHCGSPFTVNRVSNGVTSLNRPLLSIAITPQPGVLARLGNHPEFIDRGLVARFLWAMPASRVGTRSLQSKPIDFNTELGYQNCLKTLAIQHRAADNMQTVKLSPAALRAWQSFALDIEPRMSKGGDLAAIVPWASKLAAAVARIAAVVHLAENPGSPITPGNVPLEIMQRAIQVGHDLIPHSVAVHQLIGSAGKTSAALIVDRFDREGWPMGFLSLTDWWRPVRDIAGSTSKSFEPIAEQLRDHGYLIEDEMKPRQGRRFRANHQLHKPRRMAA